MIMSNRDQAPKKQQRKYKTRDEQITQCGEMGKTALVTFDHFSDVLVLSDLYRKSHYRLFGIGLIIDLLSGLIAFLLIRNEKFIFID